jgi:hypothetical protein
VLHLGLVEQHHDQLLAARLVVDDQRLVLNVRPEASAVDLHRCLQKEKRNHLRYYNERKRVEKKKAKRKISSKIAEKVSNMSGDRLRILESQSKL